MDIYYYLYNEINDEWFKEMMNAFNIKYLKNIVYKICIYNSCR